MIWNKYAGFAQDDWRIKPRWMLNLGLRYEYASPREVHNLFGNFDPNSQYGIVQQGQPDVGDTLGSPIAKTSRPAWVLPGISRAGGPLWSVPRPVSSTRRSLRGRSTGRRTARGATSPKTRQSPAEGRCPSAHLSSGRTFGGTVNLGQPQFGASQLNWNGVVYPQGGLSCTVDSQFGLMALDPHLKTPYIVNYSLNIQHTFTSNLSLEVGYVGNHGDHLIGIRDINQCAPNPNGNCVRSVLRQIPLSGVY